MVRLLVQVLMAALIIAISSQIYGLYSQKEDLDERANNLAFQIDSLEKENIKLEADLDYLSDFHNLMKEFKKLFNYRKPGEKLIIVVPKEMGGQ